MKQPRPTRILIADDHEQVRLELSGLLAGEPALQIVALACDGLQAIELTAIHRPDVVVLDIRMPEMDGLAAARLIRALDPEVRVLVLTVDDDDAHVLDMVRAGVSGYLLKERASTELLPAILALGDGKPYFGQEALQVMVRHLDG